MVRVKQFADDLGISKNKAKNLINKGRSRKDGGSQILEKMMKPKKYGDGGSNVTKVNTDKLTKAQMGQFRNIVNASTSGKITPAEAQKKIRKMLTLKKKDGGGFPDLTGDGKVTKKDILKGRGVPGFSRGGGMAIQGLGFKGVR